jgi:hypothetical protein
VPAITLIFVILAAIFTFSLAAFVVGREAHRLDALSPRVVYVEEEALSFVAERLPPDTSRVSPRTSSPNCSRSTCGGCTTRVCNRTR